MGLSQPKPTTTVPATPSGSKPNQPSGSSLRDVLLGALLGVVVLLGWNLSLKTDLRLQQTTLFEKESRISALERSVSASAVEWRGLMSEPISLFLESKTGNISIKVPYSKAPVTFIGVCRPETTL